MQESNYFLWVAFSSLEGLIPLNFLFKDSEQYKVGYYNESQSNIKDQICYMQSNMQFFPQFSVI